MSGLFALLFPRFTEILTLLPEKLIPEKVGVEGFDDELVLLLEINLKSGSVTFKGIAQDTFSSEK